ncbi:MAG: aldo/keto reductase [Spirochaetia bacterium]|nr:aldo/keto reductase [Spirochaetia bacterium]
MKQYSGVLPHCPVVLGTWRLSGWMWGGADKQTAIRTIHAALDSGIDGIDTAPVYGFGRIEEWIGEAVAGRRNRLCLADKCGMVWNTDSGTRAFESDENAVVRGGPYRVRLWLNPESMRRELEMSLRRLKTDYIDLYQVHWYDGVTPWDDIAETLIKFREEGKVREIGLCNVSTEKMLRFLKTAPVASNQERFSLLDRKAERNNAAFCHRRKIAFWAYSPLASGLLASETTVGRVYAQSDLRAQSPRFVPQKRERAAALLRELRPFREKYGLDCAAFAMAWALNVGGVTHVLAGAADPKQAESALSAVGIKIAGEDMAAIGNILDRYEADFPSPKH